MKKGKKLIVCIVLSSLVLFILYNVFWIGWRINKYSQYIDEFQTFTKYMSYFYDDDQYLYNVKLPDYLSYTGNLCVATHDGKYALLIWPKFGDEYEYGVQLEINKEVYSIMINKNIRTYDPQYQELISPYQDTIEDLFNKANEMWNI